MESNAAIVLIAVGGLMLVGGALMTGYAQCEIPLGEGLCLGEPIRPYQAPGVAFLSVGAVLAGVGVVLEVMGQKATGSRPAPQAARQGKYCMSCGAFNPFDARFCNSCGQEFPKAG